MYATLDPTVQAFEATPAPTGGVADGVTVRAAVDLPRGALLLLPGLPGRPDEEDLRAIHTAARPLLDLLAERGLLTQGNERGLLTQGNKEKQDKWSGVPGSEFAELQTLVDAIEADGPVDPVWDEAVRVLEAFAEGARLPF